MRPLSIFIEEKSPLYRSALASVVHRLGFWVTTPDPAQLKGKQGKVPDVILVDVVTFGGSLEELEESVRCYSRIAPVLLLARDDRVEQVIAGLKTGAVGFLKQTASLRELRNAIGEVARGGTYCDKKLFQLVVRYLPRAYSSRAPALTEREEQVLKYLSLGQTNKEIARQLDLAEQSIKVYISNLLRKTGTPNRSSLALYAITRGLVAAQ